MRYKMQDTRDKLRSRSAAMVSLYLASCILYLALNGCGFQLRGASSVTLPPELRLLRVSMGSGFPPLLIEVRNSLRVLGNVKLTEDATAPVPVLNLLNEQSISEVLSIDSTGRINAYLLSYRVDFSLTGADGKPLLPVQAVKLQREYTFDRLNVLATERQSEFLQNEMRRDAAQQILRRLASLNLANGAKADAAQP